MYKGYVVSKEALKTDVHFLMSCSQCHRGNDRGIKKDEAHQGLLKALHPDAELTHEASIGKIANDQLMKLMSLGLTYDESVNRIIQGFLK